MNRAIKCQIWDRYVKIVFFFAASLSIAKRSWSSKTSSLMAYLQLADSFSCKLVSTSM